MQQYFREYGLEPLPQDGIAAFLQGDAELVLAPADPRRFPLAAAKLAVVTEAELYANVVRRGRRDAGRRSNVDAMVRDLSEVRIGDPVVHEQHGIGRYLGLATLDLGGRSERVPRARLRERCQAVRAGVSLHLISRYAGASPEAAPLHELGSGQWEKAKRRAAKQAHDTAAELLNLYASAQRASATRSSSSRTTTRPSPKASGSRRRRTREARSRR